MPARSRRLETRAKYDSTHLLGVEDGALYIPVDQNFSKARVDNLIT